MSKTGGDFFSTSKCYLNTLNNCFTEEVLEKINTLCLKLQESWKEQRQIFLCGNGGSAANAIHIANDLHYGIGACGPGAKLPGLRIEALPANTGVITCLANDTGYENIYAHQIEVKSKKNDILIALSGSGNSPNITNAINTANNIGLKTFAILAFTGGKCKELASTAIHFDINDMQIAEDTQLVVGHLCMQWLNSHKPEQINPLGNG